MMTRKRWTACLAAVCLLLLLSTPATAGNVFVLTDDSLERAITSNSRKPWFIKFYAPWCSFSKKLVPVWEELAATSFDKINIAAIDATSNPLARERFDIDSYPTLILFVEGKNMYRYQGDSSLEDLQAFVAEGYKTSESQKVPPDNSWSSVQWNRFYKAVSKNKYMQFLVNALLVFHAVLIVGIILKLISFCTNRTKFKLD